jgi:hypothetical protein
MKIAKTVVGTATRSLSADYTRDHPQDIESIMGEELTRAINDELMNTMFGPLLSEEGWHCIQVGSTYWYDIPKDWVKANIRGEYRCFGDYWYFRDQADAVLFALKWG